MMTRVALGYCVGAASDLPVPLWHHQYRCSLAHTGERVDSVRPCLKMDLVMICVSVSVMWVLYARWSMDAALKDMLPCVNLPSYSAECFLP